MTETCTQPARPERERPDRPPACRHCGAPAWWNGWRLVALVALVVAGTVERVERWLSRAKCSECGKRFTCYPPGIYPRRQYQLDVVAGAVAAIVAGETTVSAVARRIVASNTSIRRWHRWIADLADPADLIRTTARIDPDTPAGAGLSMTGIMAPLRARAAQVLSCLEELGAALWRRGVSVASRSGLGRVLEWQHRAHGSVIGLVAEPRRLVPADGARG